MKLQMQNQGKKFESKDSFRKNRARSSGSRREGLFIESWSALAEYLKFSPQLVKKIEYLPEDQNRLETMLASLPLNNDIPMVQSDRFLVEVEISWISEDTLLGDCEKLEESLVIVCDHITDTRNLGAIARTAAYFGAKYLILPKDRQAPITSATLATAQGAFALISSVEVTNLSRTMRSLKSAGFWIAVADMEGKNVDELPHKYEKLALVLGSEDKGVSKSVRDAADFTISIVPANVRLESLNVSVAAGILLHSLSKSNSRLAKT